MFNLWTGEIYTQTGGSDRMCRYVLRISPLIGNSHVNRFDVYSEATLLCSQIITETAGILHSQVFGLLVSLDIFLLCSLIVTLITLIFDFLMN